MRVLRRKFMRWDSEPKHHQWYFYHCDYPRYKEMRPLLRYAHAPRDFGSLAFNIESREVLKEFAENDISLVQARQEMVETQCCMGDPFVVGREFTRVITFLNRFEAGNTGSILLEDMLFGGLNMLDWDKEPQRLVGVLTPQERRGLASSIALVRSTAPPHTPFSPSAPLLQRVLSGLLDAPPTPDITAVQFLKFLAQAKDEETGLLAFWI